MPRFVVLEHDSPAGLHWDFMLEMGPALATWSLPRPPDSAQPMTARALPDHRMAFLEYEGPISGDRGSVGRWDRGTYQVEHQSDTKLVVLLRGEKLAGRAALERTPDTPQTWRYSFTRE